MSIISIGRTLTLKRNGKTIRGVGAIVEASNLYEGSEHFMIVARSKSSLARRLRDSFPEMKVTDKVFLNVTVTLE